MPFKTTDKVFVGPSTPTSSDTSSLHFASRRDNVPSNPHLESQTAIEFRLLPNISPKIISVSSDNSCSWSRNHLGRPLSFQMVALLHARLSRIIFTGFKKSTKPRLFMPFARSALDFGSLNVLQSPAESRVQQSYPVRGSYGARSDSVGRRG
jgi:hypothetical protein